jgi:hypothetical protein
VVRRRASSELVEEGWSRAGEGMGQGMGDGSKVVRLRLVAACALLAASVGATAACSAEDVTGAPEDIGSIVRVDSAASRCSQDSDGGDVTFTVRLRNTGGDDHTVTITPRLRASDGEEIGDVLDGFKVTVAGHGETDGQGIVDHPPAHVESCFVQVDGGDDIPVTGDLPSGG